MRLTPWFLQAPPQEELIESLAAQTSALGEQPLWSGYGQPNATRKPEQVRSDRAAGRLFAWLARNRKPRVIVEFGTAFGVSGMYWLSGLNDSGELLTFEVNGDWAEIARKNLQAVSPHFTLTVGTFEEHCDRVLSGRKIDLAFIDGIHTAEFVLPQFELVVARCSPGAVILLDDITFNDSMRGAWAKVRRDARVKDSAEFRKRIGIVSLA